MVENIVRHYICIYIWINSHKIYARATAIIAERIVYIIVSALKICVHRNIILQALAFTNAIAYYYIVEIYTSSN